MYIDNLLIDTAEPNFLFADTVNKRAEVINDLKAYLYKENFEKVVFAGKEPIYMLVAESKVSEIIRDGINEENVLKELIYECSNVQAAERAFKKLNKWAKQ